MPDDETKVTEQTTEPVTEETTEEVVPEPGDNLQEALAGFNDDEEEPEEKEEKKEPSEKEEKVEEKAEALEADAEELEETKETKEEESDEDETQGKQVLEDEEKREKEAVKAEDAEQKRLEDEEAAKDAARPVKAYSKEQIALFHNAVSNDLFPKEAMIGDMEVDLQGYNTDNPEVKTISAITSKSIIDTLIKNDYLPSFEVMEEKIADLEARIDKKLLVDKITDKIPKAFENYQTEKFQKWHDKQTDKIQALFRSDKASDHIRGHKRFLKDSGMAKAEKTVADLDKKRAENKEAANDIYKTTHRTKAKAKVATGKGQSPEEQERAGFEDDEE